MEKESFRILKELNSLNQNIAPLEKKIKGELDRITKIEKLRADRMREKNLSEQKKLNIDKQLEEVEINIEKLSKSISQLESNKNSIFTEQEMSSYEKQLTQTKDELNNHEEKGLELLDQSQQLEEKIDHCHSFLKGSLESISEIEEDILKENEAVYKELKSIRSRISLLINELPEKVSKKFLKIKEQGKAPLSEISAQNSCQVCGYLIPKALITSLETTMNFHSCPGCERILIPQNSKYL